MEGSPGEVTLLLAAWRAGDKAALDALVPVVYKELRRMAHRYLRREGTGGICDTAELVSEVYLKLTDASLVDWRGRAHFLAVAARLMRRILVDFARSRRYGKRGGQAIRVTFYDYLEVPGHNPAEWVSLDDALHALEALDARKSQVVELRFFGGLSVEETAEVLAVSADTVHRDWRFARSWLRRELTRGQEA